MIESFNHYTLNTGDSRRSHPSEVDKSMYLVLKGFIRDSQKKEFVDLFDGVQFKITMTERRSYVCTLFKTIKGEHTPFLITFGCVIRKIIPICSNSSRIFMSGSITKNRRLFRVCHLLLI